MKITFLFVMLFLVLCANISAQNNQKSKNEIVSFKLKNNQVLPQKITLISYCPNETGNGTSGYLLAPYGSKTIQFEVGSKLYIADNKQVDIVMSGASIKDQKPFLVVKKEDAGKTFNIN